VRYAFQKADDGWKYWQILDGLDAIEETEKTGVKWTHERLYAMLRSEIYIGDILTNKHIITDYLQKRAMPNRGQRPQYYIEGHHEGIIDHDQFERVAARIKNHELKAKKSTLPYRRKHLWGPYNTGKKNQREENL
jgi:hypothetical protein